MNEFKKLLLKIAGSAFVLWLLLVIIFNMLKLKSKPESKTYKLSSNVLKILYILMFVIIVALLTILLASGGFIPV